MTSSKPSETTSYFGDRFTAPGLPEFQRTITGHRDDGLAYFLVRDNGDNHYVRKAAGFDFEAAEANIYATFESPVNLNKDEDLQASLHEWQGGHHAKNGTRVTILDFSPGAETPMHRGASIDYNVVLEGEIDLILDSGEAMRMRRGDVNIQRATLHKWVNVAGGGTEPSRMLNVLVDIEPLFVAGKELPGVSEGYPGPYGFGTKKKSITGSTEKK